MTPLQSRLQVLESGELSYKEYQYNQLGVDVKESLQDGCDRGYVRKDEHTAIDDEDTKHTVFVFSITEDGISYMNKLRNPVQE